MQRGYRLKASRTRSAIVALGFALAPMTAALATDDADVKDCFGEQSLRRIEACSAIIAMPGVEARVRSQAYAQRGLSHSLRSEHDSAMRDYDEAIRIDPGNAIALNNRAWSYFKTGRAMQGLPDADLSIELNPLSPHSYDTRAHIRQWNRKPLLALRDYKQAIMLGGERMVKLYQCGLQERGLYAGPISGIFSEQLWAAMEQCVENPACDPLPADEECRDSTS